MSGPSNGTPVLFEDFGIWHVTMVTKNEVLFLNFCLRNRFPVSEISHSSRHTYHNGYMGIIQKYVKLLAIPDPPFSPLASYLNSHHHLRVSCGYHNIIVALEDILLLKTLSVLTLYHCHFSVIHVAL